MAALVNITRLPPFLKICGCCEGAGHYLQTYTAGCGGGYYQSRGACEYCSRAGEAFCGPGLRYQNGEKVTDSIIAQVLTLNGIDLSPRDWIVARQIAVPGPDKITLEAA
jgi:hypothetical protein